MFSVPVRACLLLTVAAALAASAGSAQPPEGFKQPGFPKIEPGYTAFPDLKPELNQVGGADSDKLNRRIFKKFPLRVPDDATPLRKVKLHRANEGAAYLKQTFQVIAIGNWRPEFFRDTIEVASDTFLAAAATEADPAARVAWYEDRVVVLKAFEVFVRIRVETGNDPPQTMNLARYRRLEAEAELLELKGEIEKAGKK